MADDNARIIELLEQMVLQQGGNRNPSMAPRAKTMDLNDKDERAKLVKGIREYTSGLKEATSVTKSLTDVFNGAREELDFEQAGKGLVSLNEALGMAGSATEIAAITEQKAALTRAIALKTAVVTAANFASGMLKASNMILDASRAFELSIQSGASGVQAGTDNLIASIQANKQIQDTQADVLKDVSSGIGAIAMNFGPWGRAIGAAITLLGPLISSFMKFENEQEAKAKEQRAKLYGEELKKTDEVYRATTAAGALFAGGMTEMRGQAANAGMRLKDFGEAIKNNITQFHQMGMNTTDAAVRMGNVRKTIKDSELDMRFRALGMESKEQAEAIALTSAMINNAGQLRTTSDRSVAAQTFQYSKDLKVLQELTGEDAKKKMEAARKETMAADIRAQLLAKDPTGDSLKRFQQVYATVPEELKKGFLEKVSTGGAAIADVSYNIAAAQNSAVSTYMDSVYAATMNTAMSASQAQDTATKALESAGQATLNNAESMSTFATATRLTADGTLQGANAIFNSLIESGVNIKGGATEAARIIVDGTADTKDALTTAVNQLEKETDAAAVALEQRLTPSLGAAADALPRFTRAMKDAYEALESITGKSSQQSGADNANWEQMSFMEKFVSGTARSVEAVGSIIPFTDGIIKRAREERIAGETEYLKKDRSTRKQEMSWLNPASWFAKGGIAEGPSTGFPAMLHGIEAVVPLPDGKTLPVSVSMGADFMKSMQKSAPIDSANQMARPNSLFGDSFKVLSAAFAPQISAFEMVSNTIGNVGSVIAKLNMDDKPASTDVSTEIANKFATLYNQLSTQTKPSGPTNNDALMTEVRDLIKSQLSKHDEMIAQLKENVDVNQRLLNHSYT